MKRRLLLANALCAFAPSMSFAQSLVPIADAHNHLGLLRRNTESIPILGQLMKNAGISLLSWTITPDAVFTGVVNGGVAQIRVPNPGELKAAYDRQLSAVQRGLIVNGVKIIKTVEDLEQAAQGVPFACLTSEGADFLEGDLKNLALAYDQGIRHLQLVHYIKNPVGDIQTERPELGVLTRFGKDLILALNQQGMLVDLAHSTSESIQQAIDVSKVPVIWSHSYIAESASSWNAPGYRSRALSLQDAKKIADAGGAIGLWSLGASFGGGVEGYASEIIRMVNLVGAEHVMFGSDQDGLPQGSVINELADLRKVVDVLSKKGMPEKVVRAVAFENYARCVKNAIQNRSV